MTDAQKRKLTVGGIVFIAVVVLVNLDGTELAAWGIFLAFASPFILIAVVLWLLWRAGNKNPVPAAPVPLAQNPQYAMQPGWYPDQMDPTLNRWWDGTQWTSAVLPK